MGIAESENVIRSRVPQAQSHLSSLSPERGKDGLLPLLLPPYTVIYRKGRVSLPPPSSLNQHPTICPDRLTGHCSTTTPAYYLSICWRVMSLQSIHSLIGQTE